MGLGGAVKQQTEGLCAKAGGFEHGKTVVLKVSVVLLSQDIQY